MAQQPLRGAVDAFEQLGDDAPVLQLVTLYRKVGTSWVVKSTKTVTVKKLADRDKDGKKDAAYAASFAKPTAKGTYKVLARFLGNLTLRPSSRYLTFKI